MELFPKVVCKITSCATFNEEIFLEDIYYINTFYVGYKFRSCMINYNSRDIKHMRNHITQIWTFPVCEFQVVGITFS